MTFSDYSLEFEQTVLPLKKAATIATMSSHLRKLREVFGSSEIARLTQREVQAYFTGLSKTLQPKTVANIAGTMHIVMAQALREDLIVKIPSPVLPKNGRHKPECLSIDQMKKIIAGARNPTFYWLLAETGCRIGEVLGFRPADLDQEKQLLTVDWSVHNGKLQEPKTHSSLRTLSVSGRLRDLLAERIVDCDPETTIFHTSTGRPLWMSSALDDLQKTCTRVGISPVGFHAFRRGNLTTFASWEMPEGMLYYRAGHAPIGMTLKVYVQREAFIGKDLEWAEKMAEVLK